MATFFGEVTEISSRAVWWSDSDEDEVDKEVADKQVTYTTEVNNPSLVAAFQAQCKLLYVSVCKKTPKVDDELCILRIKTDGNEKNVKEGYIASLYQLSGSEHHHYWLVIDNKLTSQFAHFSPRLVDYLAENVLPPSKDSFDLFLVSSNLTRWEYSQYFSGNPVPQRLSELVAMKSLDMRPMISPETVKNEFELALLEYCIIQKLNFACFLLPYEYADRVNFLPKQIAASINEFSEIQHLNII